MLQPEKWVSGCVFVLDIFRLPENDSLGQYKNLANVAHFVPFIFQAAISIAA
ncbi:hypothetical protein [Kingella negevensis]|uniref:hypothetical protein n=1 Tax=Kingella negevensis TaxID=1522312 RepID=UPI000A723C09|nr:hypothetical protein [Kingella negevensis]WII92097.1 hypothetical protein QEO93_05945 [Kingella negevensis]